MTAFRHDNVPRACNAVGDFLIELGRRRNIALSYQYQRRAFDRRELRTRIGTGHDGLELPHESARSCLVDHLPHNPSDSRIVLAAAVKVSRDRKRGDLAVA